MERFEIDFDMPWPDHYVEHGFAVIRGCVDQAFCEKALAEVQRNLGTDLPPNQWSTETIPLAGKGGRVTFPPDTQWEVLPRVYNDPGLRQALAAMFGGIENWSGQRACAAFVAVFDPANRRHIHPRGHIDFPDKRAPLLGSGLMFQCSLVRSEPYSGNLTLYPGTHKLIQKKMLDDPDWVFKEEYPGSAGITNDKSNLSEFLPEVPVYEFVAEPGDVVFFHHLVCHNGNLNAAEGRSPRVAIHAQALANHWPNAVDPADADLSPWERSLATNGKIDLGYDEEQFILSQRAG